MPDIRIGEDMYPLNCPCGYSVQVNKARFKIMLRLHQKKCRYRPTFVFSLEEIVIQANTGRIVSKTLSPIQLGKTIK